MCLWYFEGERTGLMAVTSAVKAIDFDNITEAIPAFLTFIIIPLYVMGILSLVKMLFL